MLNQPLLLLALAAGALLPSTSAAPTPVPAPEPSKTTTSARETRTVVAGRGGLRFDPDNIFAPVGSIIEFHFLPLNHSVAEASFGAPCQPRDAGSFFSGFFPVARPSDGSAVQSAEVFQVEVRDDKPIWFYCAQNAGGHCQAGMVGVVNQRVDSGNTLEAFRRAAAGVQAPAGVQAQVQGGWRGENPNPLSGF